VIKMVARQRETTHHERIT